ncbi:hypothetical protein [Chitinophaga silvisoli]|uniref:Uncharacterized protein n=1 Tax=Chitinophaga silvisoli TaxID=2291814 RepID=A0A3E1NZ39_9BACT|nr:hypothetical protein [Chitinophaga silvisoli]RFM33183.1 hypothetical protein DXN04_19320 [Chitinophaga silvisoli]
MAMFNIIADLDDTTDINEVLVSLSEFPRKVISIFPVISTGLQTFDGVGITVSGQDINKLFQIKEELVMVLDFLWQKNFTIRELYNGSILTRNTYKEDLDYFWNLPHEINI